MNERQGIEVRMKKDIVSGIISMTSGDCPGQTAIRYVEYEPGNGTRYRLLFSNVTGADVDGIGGGWVVTCMNSLRSMAISDNGGFLHFNYVMEKMHVGVSDAICLAEIIGHCTNHTYISCEEFMKDSEPDDLPSDMMRGVDGNPVFRW